MVYDRGTLDTNPGGKFSGEALIDKVGGMLICSFLEQQLGTPCPGIKVTDNIVAGVVSIGYTAPGHECGASAIQETFRGNVAHSINANRFENGMGLVSYPDPTSANGRKCYETSHFAGYKCAEMAIFASFVTKKMIYNGIISIDNRRGIGGQAT